MRVFDWTQWLVLPASLIQVVLRSSVAGPAAIVRSLSNIDRQFDVVVVAHQDDWQVFMGDVVANRIKAGDSLTFIYLTAGDDGRDSLYWRTRERGALQSTLVAAGVRPSDSAIGCSTRRVAEHEVQECLVGSTRSYFLRLPDGKRNGAGFGLHSYQSLRKLRARKITAISAIDGSTSYRGWDDVVATVRQLIGSSSREDITLHTTDPSITVNPHDHFDHRMAGLLVADLRKTRNWKARYYVGYALATRAANRSQDQAREKTAIFLAYDKEMMRVNRQWSAYAEHPAFYSQCMLRTYARSAPVPQKR